MNTNDHKIPKDANLKDFINMERYFNRKPAIFNKFYQTNILQIVDRLPSLSQKQQQKFKLESNPNQVKKRKIIKNDEQQKMQEEILLKNSTLAYHHQTDRLNQDIQVNQYLFSGLLGRGAHSVVRLCRQNSEDLQKKPTQYAVKILWFEKIRKKYFISAKQLIQMITNQILILKELRSPYIIEFKEAIYYKEKQRMFIVLQHCSKGPITKLINNNLTTEEEEWWEIVKGYFKEFVLGIKTMHAKNIVHRDIKPQNLLINQNGHLKIIDFNVSHRIGQDNKIKITNKFIGTKLYAAPQLLLNIQRQKYCDGKKIDIWAMGIALIELLQRRHPYPAKTLPQLIKVLQNYRDYALKLNCNNKDKQSQHIQQFSLIINQKYPQQLRDLLSKMIKYESQERISIEQIAQHQWLNKK